MRPPDFWRRSPPSPIARLLTPFSRLYGAAAAERLSRPGASAGLPTIVIGGLTSGGDGKTPAALALAALLDALGRRPAFLTRGYGRRLGARREPFVVDLARDTAVEAGDEPLLLARQAPTIVAVDRIGGARLARDLGASVLILDDGLQSRRLQPDLALAVVDGEYGAGNGLCMPAGPLRAPLDRQIDAVDAVVVIGSGEAGENLARLARAAGKEVFFARLEASGTMAARLCGERVFAFAGIARPEKFSSTLRAAGAQIAGVRWFSDHHRFSGADIAGLRRSAARLNARLITTEKDAARLPDDSQIIALPVELVLDEPSAIRAMLQKLSLGA